MDIAIVTGASSSLGLAVSKRLIQLGFRVYGLGGDYTNCPLNNVNFKPKPCDLADPDAVEAACRQILDTEKGVYVLVHNAKYFGRNAFPEMDNQEMERILRINLLCPLILSRTLAETLMTLQGYIIQLGSPYAETTRGGPAGAAASGGLKWMGEVLFQDLRGHGVRVCHISPEPNRGRDPRTVVRPGARLEATIDPDAVAQAVEQIIQSPYGNIVTEMIMRPLRVSEPEHDPVVRLPYPEPKPVPYTVPREMIEAEEQLEDEEIEKNLQRRKRERGRGKKREETARESEGKSGKSAPRKTRSKDSGKSPEDRPKADRAEPAKKAQQETSPAQESPAETPAAEDTPSKPFKSRRRGRRKPKPPMTQVGFLDRTQGDSEQSKPDGGDTGPEKGSRSPDSAGDSKTGKPDATSGESASPEKPARKAAKKAARKPVKKAAKKARPAKKAASTDSTRNKKAGTKKAATKKRPARKRTAKKAAPSSDGKSG